MRVCVNVRGSIRLNSSIHSAWFRSSRLSFIHSFSLFPIEQLIFLRFQYNIEISFIEIFIYVDERRKQKFQFLSVFFFFKNKNFGTRRKIFLFHRNDVYNGGGIAFRVERFPCHSKGSSYLFLSASSLSPGFVLLYANQSTPTYVALRVLSSSLRGWFLARTRLRATFVSFPPSLRSSLHALGIHVHPGRSDVSLTLIQRW